MIQQLRWAFKSFLGLASILTLCSAEGRAEPLFSAAAISDTGWGMIQTNAALNDQGQVVGVNRGGQGFLYNVYGLDAGQIRLYQPGVLPVSINDSDQVLALQETNVHPPNLVLLNSDGASTTIVNEPGAEA